MDLIVQFGINFCICFFVIRKFDGNKVEKKGLSIKIIN